jgi:hypothetical protein
MSNEIASSLILNRVVKNLLDNLKERPREIIIKRFGLDGKDPKVLGNIGDEFGITRERVRQIEGDSFKKLQAIKKDSDFEQLIEATVAIIEENGGFCEKKKLKETLKSDITKKERNQIMFILNSSKRLSFKKGKLSMRGFWFLRGDKIDREVLRSHNSVVRFIKAKKVPSLFEEILVEFRNSEHAEFFAGETGVKRMRMILEMSRLVNRNILEEWGMKNWKIISERGAREKAFLVLKKHDTPLHFRKITKHINFYWGEKKEALPQTVHNELIKDARFVLVGRGIYGLNDWGFPEGTVKEVIFSFLDKQIEPLERDLIIEYVLSKKQVKETTVKVTLADRNVFHKTDDGKFTLKKRNV